MPLKCVPLRPEWTGSTGPDIRAIYKRRKADNFGNPILDADGNEQWDATTALPLRRHSDWANKGFQYITLADEESLGKVANQLRADGIDPHSFIQDRRTRSPFNAQMWMEDQRSAEEARVTELRALIQEFGVDAVVAMRGPLPAGLAAEYLDERTENLHPVTLDSAAPVEKRKPGRPKKVEAEQPA